MWPAESPFSGCISLLQLFDFFFHSFPLFLLLLSPQCLTPPSLAKAKIRVFLRKALLTPLIHVLPGAAVRPQSPSQASSPLQGCTVDPELFPREGIHPAPCSAPALALELLSDPSLAPEGICIQLHQRSCARQTIRRNLLWGGMFRLLNKIDFVGKNFSRSRNSCCSSASS